jgi:vacuolar protein sorting-associated protein IST1
MGNSGIQFNQTKLKANLQMGISRLTLLKNKRINQISVVKDEIAGLLHSGKEEMAMVKVESIINHENFITAIEVLIMFCAQLIERVFQIASTAHCPDDLTIAVSTIIWASCKIDCKELIEVRTHLGAKFGFNFCHNAAENKDGLVNSIVRDKLVNSVPSEEMKVVKIQEIAAEKRIDFVFKHSIRQEIQSKHMPPPNSGFGGEGYPPASNGFPAAGNYPAPGSYPDAGSYPAPGNFPPGNYPPAENFPSAGGYPPPGNYPSPGNYPPPPSYPPTGNYPAPDNFSQRNEKIPSPFSGFPAPSSPDILLPQPEEPRTGSPFKSNDPANAKFELPPSVPSSGGQDYDIDSLEERFKRLK